MSFDLIVYLRREKMPTPAQWQRAISDADFPVVIDQKFDVDSFTGFLPCKFKGSLSGFEYFSARISVEDAVALEVSESDFSITLVVHPGHNELPTAVCVASGGLLVDPQSGDTFLSSNVVPWAQSVIVEYLEDPL